MTRNFNIQLQGQAIETVEIKGLKLDLLGHGDGTEIIRHHLKAGSRWAMIPDESWQALECMYVLSGQLRVQITDQEQVLTAGDFLSAAPVREHAVFIADVDTEFLYISSQPVFHLYSEIIQEMMNMAIQVEEKDGYTANHCQRITNYSMLVGEALGLNSDQMFMLNYGAFLHDVGKVRIPEEILFKPGKLTPEEWEIMKMHTVYGRQILDATGLPKMQAAGIIAEQHHERFDGTGYPYGLKGDEISICAAIVSVVDSFDAMTTDRVYQKKRTKEQALAEIKRCQGTYYHPQVVEAFLSIADKIDS